MPSRTERSGCCAFGGLVTRHQRPQPRARPVCIPDLVATKSRPQSHRHSTWSLPCASHGAAPRTVALPNRCPGKSSIRAGITHPLSCDRHCPRPVDQPTQRYRNTPAEGYRSACRWGPARGSSRPLRAPRARRVCGGGLARSWRGRRRGLSVGLRRAHRIALHWLRVARCCYSRRHHHDL